MSHASPRPAPAGQLSHLGLPVLVIAAGHTRSGCQFGCSSLGTFGAETTTVQRRFMIHFGGFREQRPRACLRIGNAEPKRGGINL